MKKILRITLIAFFFSFVVSCTFNPEENPNNENETTISTLKIDAIKEISLYFGDDTIELSSELRVVVTNKLNEYIIEISKATTISDINQFITSAKEFFDDTVREYLLVVELKAYKVSAINEIDAYVEENEYDQSSLSQVNTILSSIKSQINNATSKESIDSVVSMGKLTLDNVVPINIEQGKLNEAKANALESINTIFNLNLYDEFELEKINQLIFNSTASIENALTINEVAGIVDDVLAKKNDFLTIKQKEELLLVDYKILAKQTIDDYPNMDKFYGENLDSLNQMIIVFKSQIDLATTVALVDEIVEDAKEMIDQITPTEIVDNLDEIKSESKREIENLFVLSLYDAQEVTIINQLIDDALLDIENATTISQINQIVNFVKTQKESILTSAEKTGDELSLAKQQGITEVYSVFNLSLYDSPEKEQINDLITSAILLINDATTIDDVTEVVEYFKSKKSNYLTTAQKEANALDFAKISAISEIETIFDYDLYDEVAMVTIDSAITTAKTNIYKASSIAYINLVIQNLYTLKSTLLTIEQKLTNAKNKAIEDIKFIFNLPLYDAAEKAQINQLLSKAEQDIMNAASEIEVLDIIDTLKAAKQDILTSEEKSEQNSLVDFKNSKKAFVDSYLNKELYDAEEIIEINLLINDTKSSIESATSINEINQIIDTFIINADNILTSIAKYALVLTKAKGDAIIFINNLFNLSLYDTTDVIYITNLISIAKNHVNMATTLETITSITNALEEEKTNILTKEEKESQTNTISQIRINGIREITEYLNISLYDAIGQNEIEGIINEATSLINSAETFEEVNQIVLNTKSSLDSVKKDNSTIDGDKEGSVVITSISGLNETASITWSAVIGATSYIVSYKEVNGTEIEVDSELIRKNRVDIPGLKGETTHQIKITPVYNTTIDSKNATVTSLFITSYDRSGYAHFNYNEGIGGYNNDGTLKDSAIVVYVTDENKNTVTIPGYESAGTGIGWILNNNQYSNWFEKGITAVTKEHPVVIRIIGKVTNPAGTTAYNSTEQGGSKGDNGHMARMKNAKNLTIEGIGTDAMIYDWGIHFMAVKADSTNNNTTGGYSFEVRNITFDDYPEDALGMEGVQSGSTLTAPVERCWIHNNNFLSGYSSNPAESDKAEGDGSCDFKRGNYYTLSYNYFESAHKTNLIGASDDNLQFNITFHHNYWKDCGSRLPLVRQANIHMYNNYFQLTDAAHDINCATDARANAFVYSEYNFYENAKKAVLAKNSVVKSFNNTYYGCYDDNQASITTSRTESFSSNNRYANFDTNSSTFYYDSVNKRSDVKRMTSAFIARTETITYAGVQKASYDNIEIPGLITTVPTSYVSSPLTIDFIGQGTTNAFNAGTFTPYNNVLINPSKTYKASSSVSLTIKAEGIIFKLDKTTSFEMVGVSGSYVPVLVNEEGFVLIVNSGKVILNPGIYLIESSVKSKESKIDKLIFS